MVEANVGIAVGSGTDVARESADVILIGSDLSKFVDAVGVARRCRAIIMQNFVGTLAVDSIGVGMAAFGDLNLLVAAFIHVTSELAFILNSTRLLPRTSEIGRFWLPTSSSSLGERAPMKTRSASLTSHHIHIRLEFRTHFPCDHQDRRHLPEPVLQPRHPEDHLKPNRSGSGLVPSRYRLSEFCHFYLPGSNNIRLDLLPPLKTSLFVRPSRICVVRPE